MTSPRRQPRESRRRFARVATSALLITGVGSLPLLGTSPANAETAPTTEQAATAALTWIDGTQSFFAYTAAGETLDVNFTPVNIKIANLNYEGPQARANLVNSVQVTVTAPDNTSVTCTLDDGTAVSVSNADPTPVADQEVCDWDDLPSATAGVWKVDLVRGTEQAVVNTPLTWTISAQSDGADQPGRVWSEDYQMTQYGRAAGVLAGVPAGVDFSLWYLGENGYRYQADYGNYNGYSSEFAADAFGVVQGDTCESAYRSVSTMYINDDGSVDGGADAEADGDASFDLSAGNCGPLYHIFFESPATDMPASAQLGDGSTVFVNPAVTTPVVDSLVYDGATEDFYIGDFNGLVSNFTGNAELHLDIEDDGTVDRTLPVAVGSDGSFSVTWDGEDADGEPVPVTTRVKVSLNVDKVGEIHFIRVDAERSGSLAITRLNGSNPGQVALNWDDSSLAAGERLCTTDPLTSPEGGVDSSGGVHGWACDGYSISQLNFNNGTNGGWGDARVIDDWTYEASLAEPFVFVLGPDDTASATDGTDSDDSAGSTSSASSASDLPGTGSAASLIALFTAVMTAATGLLFWRRGRQSV
ncbi:MAG: hypothetical protein QM597_09725 [Aeromicrobium sp.]|uniref:hypothetical protein n=1 Tax=Aeromicrobium sp. TaxID=1871063 RepID=UPI0039E54CB6